MAALACALAVQPACTPGSQANSVPDSIELLEHNSMLNPYAWRIIFKSDGTAQYSARFPVGMLEEGDFQSEIDPSTYARLAQLFRDAGFSGMQESYHESKFNDAGMWVLTLRVGTTARSVEDYALSGPNALWGLEQAVKGVAAGMRWKAVSK